MPGSTSAGTSSPATRAFFAITKRIHNRLHGADGDGGELAASEAEHYAKVTTANAGERHGNSCDRVTSCSSTTPRPPGMAALLAEAGARVVWRCHVGRDGRTSGRTRRGRSCGRTWRRARRSSSRAAQYVPEWIDDPRVRIIPPSIDPFSPKNQDMTDADVILGLRRIGLVESDGATPPVSFVRNDGTRGRSNAGRPSSRTAPRWDLVIRSSSRSPGGTT